MNVVQSYSLGLVDASLTGNAQQIFVRYYAPGSDHRSARDAIGKQQCDPLSEWKLLRQHRGGLGGRLCEQRGLGGCGHGRLLQSSWRQSKPDAECSFGGRDGRPAVRSRRGGEMRYNRMEQRTALFRRAATRRRRTQKGQELMEFGMVMGLVLAPLFLGMIVYGTNLIQSNRGKRTLPRNRQHSYWRSGPLYRRDTSLGCSTLAAGLNLQVGTTGGAANTSNSTGSGIVTITQMTYVGTT